MEGLKICDAEIVGSKDKPGDLLNGLSGAGKWLLVNKIGGRDRASCCTRLESRALIGSCFWSRGSGVDGTRKLGEKFT